MAHQFRPRDESEQDRFDKIVGELENMLMGKFEPGSQEFFIDSWQTITFLRNSKNSLKNILGHLQKMKKTNWNIRRYFINM